jgi:APA family basic amino acid/polyamine antiporter
MSEKELITVSDPATEAPTGGALKLPAATALIMGSIVGTGIFTLPSAIARFGMAGMAGFVIATIGAIALALVFASLARIIPAQGGPYAYAREGFGDLAGFLNAFSYWCAVWPGNAAIVISWVFYVQALFGWDPENRSQSIVIALVGLWAPVFINLRGAGSMGRFQVITTVLKFMPLIFLATVGLFFAVTAGNWPAWNPSGGSTVAAISGALTVATFSYVGVEAAAIAAAKVRNPVKNVPTATVLGTLSTAVIYLLVTTAIFGIVPNERLQTSGAPFSDAFNAIFGGAWSGRLVALFAVISGLGALNSWTMVSGEVPQAAARDRLFPEIFDRENRNGVPAFGIVVSTVLASLSAAVALGVAGGVEAFTHLVLFCGVTVGVPYFFSILVQLYYLYTDGRRLHPATFPREVILAIIALVFTGWMIAGSGQLAAYLSLLIFGIGFVFMTCLYIRTGRFGAGDRDAGSES